jgi:hypothetical protein
VKVLDGRFDGRSEGLKLREPPEGVGIEMPAADRHSWIFWKSAPANPRPEPGVPLAPTAGVVVATEPEPEPPHPANAAAAASPAAPNRNARHADVVLPLTVPPRRSFTG